MQITKIWMGLIVFGTAVSGLWAQSSSDIWRLETKIDRVDSRVNKVESDLNRTDWDVRRLTARVTDLENQNQGSSGHYDRAVDAKIDLSCMSRLQEASPSVFSAAEIVNVIKQCREAVDTKYCYKESEVSNADCFARGQAMCISTLTPDQAMQFEAACKTQKFRCMSSH